MSIVLYIGGSKHGTRGVMPYGFTKSMLETESGHEIYVERLIPMQGRVVRVMALDSMATDCLESHVADHFATLD